jgi:hypothetical protein
MGKVGVWLVNFALLITQVGWGIGVVDLHHLNHFTILLQFGFVLVYILFIAEHLNEVR